MSSVTSTYDTWMKFRETREAIERVKADDGLSDAVIRYLLDLFDEVHAEYEAGGQFKPLSRQRSRRLWDNKDRPRGKGELVDFEVPDGFLEENGGDLDDTLAQMLEVGNERATKIHARLNPPPPPPPPSKEALRKRKARAAGKVKPRPKKPARTVAQEVASREKALATHRAKLATAKAQEYAATGNLFKLEEAVRRAEKTLETYRQRLIEEKLTAR